MDALLKRFNPVYFGFLVSGFLAVMVLCPVFAFGLDSVDLKWRLDYTTGAWSKPGDGNVSDLIERSGTSVNVNVNGSSTTTTPYVQEHYVSVNGNIKYTYHESYKESTNYAQSVNGALLESKGFFNTLPVWIKTNPSTFRVTLYSTWEKSDLIKDVDLLYATPNSVVALQEKTVSYYITNVSSWDVLYSYDGSNWTEFYNDTVPLKGIAFTTVIPLTNSGKGDVHYIGVPQLPSLMIGDQSVPAIKQQTKELSSTDGSSGVVSGVSGKYNKDAFDTRLGAVSQIADMSGQLFTAVLDGNEGKGINYAGYSVTLPSGDVLAVPAQVVDIWSYFPEAETPVRTICTAMLVILFIKGIHHLYDRFIGNEVEVTSAGDD